MAIEVREVLQLLKEWLSLRMFSSQEEFPHCKCNNFALSGEDFPSGSVLAPLWKAKVSQQKLCSGKTVTALLQKVSWPWRAKKCHKITTNLTQEIDSEGKTQEGSSLR